MNTVLAKKITSRQDLDALYGKPASNAIIKEVDYITDHYRTFIEKSPFMVMATVGEEGTDCSPRGDPGGFVRVLNSHELLIPDRKGNNRLDSLKNLVADPRISLLFMIPGINQTLRINGEACIVYDPELAQSFVINGKAPLTLIHVIVKTVYFQCPKALVRSGLWSLESQLNEDQLPTSGQMLAEITNNGINAKQYDEAYPERLRQTIY